MRRLYRIALNNHHILWTTLFGLGLFLGNSFSSSLQISSFIYYFITGTTFLASLGGPVYIFMNNKIIGGDIPETKILILLVLIPLILMMVMGLLVSANNKESSEIDLSLILENKKYVTPGVIKVVGRVSTHPFIKHGSLYFEMDLKSLEYGTDSRKINIIVKRSGDLKIRRDDLIEVKGEAITSAIESSIRTVPGNIRFIDEDSFSQRVFKSRKAVYNCISQTFYKYLNYRYATIAEALLLGNRTNVPGSLLDDFRQSGTAHLMAISGMHISFIVLITYLIIGRSRQGLVLAVCIAGFLVLYNFLLGLRASVLRASIWMMAALFARQWNRESNKSRILCISFILLIILDPSFIHDIGFWFSFAAMAGVVFVYPVLLKAIFIVPVVKKFVNNHIFRTLIITFSIQLICGPLILYYFKTLPLISCVSNICILPFFYALLLLLMISASFSIFWPPFGGIILKSTPPLFKMITSLTALFSRPGLPVLKVSGMIPLHLFVYYLALCMVLMIIHSCLEKIEV